MINCNNCSDKNKVLTTWLLSVDTDDIGNSKEHFNQELRSRCKKRYVFQII